MDTCKALKNLKGLKYGVISETFIQTSFSEHFYLVGIEDGVKGDFLFKLDLIMLKYSV